MTQAGSTSTTLDPTTALALAQASVAAYAAFEKIGFQLPANYKLVDQWTGWDALLTTGVEELYGLVFQSMLPGESGTFIFAFRGTDSDMDIYEDLHFETTEFVPTHNSVSPTPMVSAGFYGIYDQLGGRMTQSMRNQLFSLLARYKPSQLYVTGHSLGAALSQLFSLDLAISQPTPSLNINFSSPMVGTADWQTAYEKALPAGQSIRCYNYWDYVPSLPPSEFGYKPVGSAFRTAFYVLDEWFPHVLSRHSIVNLQTVLTHALPENPQVWVGTFPDYIEPSWLMQSEKPPLGPDVQWVDQALRSKAIEQDLRSSAYVDRPLSRA
jgi:hypothetical protein